MIRLAIPALAVFAFSGEGFTHGPGACYKYDKEAHVVAGAAIAYLIDRAVDLPQWARASLALSASSAVGFGKEYLVDKHASNREALDWTLGAALVIGARWEF